MNNKWLKAVFILSVTVNAAVFGVLGYSLAKNYLQGQCFPSLVMAPVERGLPEQAAQSRAEFLKKLQQEKKVIQDAQNRLAQLFMDQPVNRQDIDDTVKTILQHQGKIQHSIVAQILLEIDMITPEQRKLYLSTIQEKICPKKLLGLCRDGSGFQGGRGCDRNAPAAAN